VSLAGLGNSGANVIFVNLIALILLHLKDDEKFISVALENRQREADKAVGGNTHEHFSNRFHCPNNHPIGSPEINLFTCCTTVVRSFVAD
jgi:hypothetical protein